MPLEESGVCLGGMEVVPRSEPASLRLLLDYIHFGHLKQNQYSTWDIYWQVKKTLNMVMISVYIYSNAQSTP